MKYRIIFVDDDRNLLDGLKRSFRKKKEEWDVVFYDEPSGALLDFDNNSVDLIVTDYKMPGMDGLELLENIKNRFPETVRILLSGQSECEIFNRAKELNHMYIEKPCSNEDLLAAIEKGLRNR